MKKYETLKNEMLKALADDVKKNELFTDLRKTFTNEALIFNALTNSELLQLLMCKELIKAMSNKKYTLIHDSDFAKSKAQTVKTHICSYIDDANKRVLHIYANSKTVSVSFASDVSTLEKVALASQLKNAYEIKHKYKTDKSVKDTFINVSFDDTVNASKFALLILESSLEDLQKMLEAEAE